VRVLSVVLNLLSSLNSSFKVFLAPFFNHDLTSLNIVHFFLLNRIVEIRPGLISKALNIIEIVEVDYFLRRLIGSHEDIGIGFDVLLIALNIPIPHFNWVLFENLNFALLI